jgi:DNA-binding beta-propeller fold protein YncE
MTNTHRFACVALACVGTVTTAACGAQHLVPTLQPRSVDANVYLPDEPLTPGELHDVVLVGNNWDGTVTIFDPHRLTKITTIDVTTDLRDRFDKINTSRRRANTVALNRRVAGEGNDQLVDDVFTSPDGRLMFVSRPSLGDVVAFDLQTRQIRWQTDIEGFRADHAALSNDGKTLLVSATRARKVHAIDTETGTIKGGFPSGDQPHESHFSDDNERIYHASIGRIFFPVRSRFFPWIKGDRWLQIVNATDIESRCLPRSTNARDDCSLRRCIDSHAGIKTPKCIDMKRELEEYNRSGAESAVRPMAVTRAEDFIYMQISFLHGFLEYDLSNNKITRIKELPIPPAVGNLPASKYQLNSAHHGLALSGDETKLCVAGTMSGYAAIVNRKSFDATIVDVGEKPYWSTRSADGRHCYVSVSGRDLVAVIDFAEEKKIGDIMVGDHPQRVRNGKMHLPAAAAHH